MVWKVSTAPRKGVAIVTTLRPRVGRSGFCCRHHRKSRAVTSPPKEWATMSTFSEAESS